MSAANPHPTLRSPIALGPIELRNRIVSTSHQTGLVHDHLPTADLVAYHEARARGGVGAIFLEATAMHATGLLTAHTIGGFLPEIVPEYGRLGEAIRRHGVIVRLDDRVRPFLAISPPLISTREHVDELGAALRAGLAEVAAARA